MQELYWATIMELSGAPAGSPALIDAGLLEPESEIVPYRRPRALSAVDFRRETEEARLFAMTAAHTFLMFRNDTDTLRDWLANSEEYRSLCSNWSAMRGQSN